MSGVRSWLPWYRGTELLPLPPRQVRRALETLIDPRDTLLSWVTPPRLPYRGSFDGTGFGIRAAGMVANGFRPLIVGTVAEAAPGTSVRFTVRPPVISGAFIAIWLLMWVGGGIGLALQEYRAGHPFQGGLLLPFGVAGAVLAFWVWNVRRAAHHFQAQLRQLAATTVTRRA